MEPPTTSPSSSRGTVPAAAPTVDAGRKLPPAKLPPRILLACLAALVVFAGSVVLLYYTWLPRQNPNAMLVLIGDPDYAGATVTLVPIGSAGGSITATFQPVDDYRLRFHVPPGLYHVTVEHRARTVLDADAEAQPGLPRWIRLPRPGRSNRAATGPVP
jgi:hypothetical protein